MIYHIKIKSSNKKEKNKIKNKIFFNLNLCIFTLQFHKKEIKNYIYIYINKCAL